MTGIKKIFSNISWLFLEKIFRLSVGLFVATWIAKYLGPEQFGLWNFAIAFAALFGIFSTLGLDNIVVRDIVKEPNSINEILGSAFFLKFIGAIVALVLAAIVIYFVRSGYNLVLFLVIVTSAGFLFQAFNTIDFHFQSQVLSKYAAYARSTAFIIISVIEILLILLSAPLMAFALAGLAEVILASIFLISAYYLNNHSMRKWRVSFSMIKRLLMDSWPLFLSSIAIMFYLYIDQIMLGQMVGDKEVGIYSAAVRISEMWYFIPVIIADSVFPYIVILKKNSEELYYSRIQDFYNVMVLIGLSIAIIITFSSQRVIGLLFGRDYIEAASILSLHIWSGLFVCLGVASGRWLVVENLQRYSAYRAISGMIANIILNLFLIPKYKGYGAALATLGSISLSAYFFDFLNIKTRKNFFMKTRSLILLDFVRKIFYGKKGF